MSTHSGPFENDRRRAFALSIGIITASAFLGGVLFLRFQVSTEWIAYLVLVALFGAFVLDSIMAWNALYERFSAAILALMAALNGLASYLAASAVGATPTDASYTFIGVIILMGFFEGVEHAYIRARTVVRVLRGLRTSGDPMRGSVAATVDLQLLDTFGVDTFEDRLQRELEDTAEDQAVLHFVPRESTDLGFNIQRVGSVRTLFRIKDGLFEALCVPTDGVVARFEDADDHARELRFIANHILHFGTPSPHQLETISSHLREAYAKYAAPTFDLRAIRRSILETWRIRRSAILLSILSLAVAVAGAVAIVNASAVLAILSEPRVNAAAATLFYVGATIGLVVASLRWVWKRAGRKTAK